MDERKVEHTFFIPTTDSQIDANNTHPWSSRARLIPGCIAFLVFLGITALFISATDLLHLPNRGSIPMASSDRLYVPVTVSLSPLVAPQVLSTDAKPSFIVKVTLTNTGDVTLVILKWWTPFAHGAPAMGIFKVTDSWGTSVPDMGLMIDYLFPEDDTFVLQKGEDSTDNLLLIRPGESLTQEVEIANPEMLVEKGNKYSVKAKGSWMAVWKGEGADGRYPMKDAIGGGYFESETVEVQT